MTLERGLLDGVLPIRRSYCLCPPKTAGDPPQQAHLQRSARDAPRAPGVLLDPPSAPMAMFPPSLPLDQLRFRASTPPPPAQPTHPTAPAPPSPALPARPDLDPDPNPDAPHPAR